MKPLLMKRAVTMSLSGAKPGARRDAGVPSVEMPVEDASPAHHTHLRVLRVHVDFRHAGRGGSYSD